MTPSEQAPRGWRQQQHDLARKKLPATLTATGDDLHDRALRRRAYSAILSVRCQACGAHEGQPCEPGDDEGAAAVVCGLRLREAGVDPTLLGKAMTP